MGLVHAEDLQSSRHRQKQQHRRGEHAQIKMDGAGGFEKAMAQGHGVRPCEKCDTG
jgi:hypothetical protein